MAPASLDERLAAIAARAHDVARADARQLDDLRTELLGRKAGALTEVLRALPSLTPDERRVVGQRANQIKRELEAAIGARQDELTRGERAAAVDLTMPARTAWRGAIHPVTRVVDEICDIFRELGFARVVGPEAETEEYNFTKLNIPLDHPAADMHDTFYLKPGVVLRTHTSPVQARVMERYPPPIRVVVPGLVYRRDPWDPSHAPVFEQIEGLVVDEGVSFVDFKAAIDYFVHHFFSADTAVRFRPSFFPFTEPSAEVDVRCQMCRGSGCSTCKQTGWMEIMGAGMVHPAVFESCGIDAERNTGYAFGMGPGRIALVRYGIPDIRMLYQNDMRFLAQFAE
ncbi:MAG: phenylalanine--tRNA ligase subunit alpha [Gemmatimonadota bacterium]|nr:phenylalanine--tRNA ligase subunit alpha [Gemmatimonadota bacterium]MDH5197630.1 phenylalanine--tRNA ligase subunit alpha [Gemmatimonadota bacterium]